MGFFERIGRALAPEVSDRLAPLTPVSDPLPLLDLTKKQVDVGRYGALMSGAFLACETAKARSLRSLPVKVLQREATGRVPLDDHPLARVLHRPNALMTWGDLMAWLVIRRDVFGTAYIRVYRDPRGGIVELRPVTASVTMAYDKETGTAVYSANADHLNEAWTCREDDLIIVKTDASEDGGITGVSIAKKAAADIGLSIDLPRFYASLVENGNHFPGWLSTPEKLRPEDMAAIRESMDAMRGADGAGKVPIFDRGLTYNAVSVALADMDIIGQERWVLEKVCRACHVDLHHVYADGGTTATGATGYDIDYAKNTIVPEVTAIEQALQVVLDRAASLGGKDSGLRVKFDLNGLLRGDFVSRMNGYRIGVYSGIFTRAYCCTQEDIPWLPGQDKLLQPTAYYMVDGDGEPYVPASPTEGTAGQSDGVSGIDERALRQRLAPVIADACDRIAKRAARDGDTPATREFAAMVAAPLAECCIAAGVPVDFQQDIDNAIERGTHA